MIFSADVPRLAAFYELVLGVAGRPEASGDVRLVGDGTEVLIHRASKKFARQAAAGGAASPREEAAIKPAFDVASLGAALAVVEPAGGAITSFTFTSAGVTRHDVVDPDGNVIQLRARAYSDT